MLRHRLHVPFYPSAATMFALVLALLPGVCPSSLAAAAQSSSAGAIPGYEIIRLGRGNYNRILVTGTIDGVKGLLFVDTGAVNTTLSAAKYGFLLKNGVKRPAGVPATTHVNELSVPVAMGKDVQLGSVHLSNVAFPLLPEHFLYDRIFIGAQDQQYDGVVGENILRRYNAVIDCGRLLLYLNTDPARKLDVGHALFQNVWTRVPMTDVDNEFTVPCTLGGHQYRLLVDTGSPFTVFERSVLFNEDIRQDEGPLSGAVVGYTPTKQSMVRLDTLQVGNYRATNLQPISDPGLAHALSLAKPTAKGTPIVGLLGGDFLGRNNAMIDVGGHGLFLRAGGPGASPTPR